MLLVFCIFQSYGFIKEMPKLSSHGAPYFDYDSHYKLAGFFHARMPKDTPKDMLAFIKNNPLPKNMFNTFNLGALLIYNFYPQRRVFIDGRAEFYGKDFFAFYADLLSSKPGLLERAVEKYSLSGFILDFSVSPPKIIKELYKKGYACVYFSQDGIIFLKNTPAAAAYIAKHKINLSSNPVSRFSLKEIGLSRVPVERFVKMAEVYFMCGLYKQAKAQLSEVLKIGPLNPRANYLMAEIY